jgi:hypothetical protein
LRHSIKAGVINQIINCINTLVQAVSLKDKANMLSVLVYRDILTENGYYPGIRMQQSENNPYRGSLAGAVRPQITEYISCFNLKTNIFEDFTSV